MDRRSAVLLLCGCLISACDQGGGGGSAAPTDPPGSFVVPTTGGKVTLPGVAAVTVPAGAFAAATRVKISQTSTLPFDEPLQQATILFRGSNLVAPAIKVEIQAAQPSLPLSVSIVLPAGYASALAAGRRVSVFVATSNSSEFENPYLIFEQIVPTVDVVTNEVTLSVSKLFFTNIDSTSSNIIALFVVTQASGPL